jgi:hypothetical protein
MSKSLLVVNIVVKIQSFTYFILLCSPGTEEWVASPLYLAITVIFKINICRLLNGSIAGVARLETPRRSHETAKSWKSNIGYMCTGLNMPTTNIIDRDQIDGR